MKNYTLKSLRAKKGLRQKDLAKVLNISASTYSSKENGERRFTIEEAIAIADFFNQDIREIFLTS
ncbi:MAG: helix-turn-helix transcriptional regulator [Paeniclostridium sordellii]|nr:helix-turn-helix transcriptional regulator [Paeniclostridium sordellii]